MYAMVTNAASQVVMCYNSLTTVRGYLSLQQTGLLLSPALTPSLQPYSATLTPLAKTRPILLAFAAGDISLDDVPSGPLRDGIAAILAQPVTVPVLSSDPYTVCHEGAHRGIWPVAFAVLVGVSMLFPLLSLILVHLGIRVRMGDPDIRAVGSEEGMQREAARERVAAWGRVGGSWMALPLPGLDFTSQRLRELRAKIAGAEAARAARETQELAAGHAYVESPEEAHARVTLWGALQAARAESMAQYRAALEEARCLIDGAPEVTFTPLMRAWTAGDRRASLYYFTQVDQLVLLVIALPSAYNKGRVKGNAAQGIPATGDPVTYGLQCFALALVLVVVGGTFVATLRAQPYAADKLWMHWAKLSILVLAALSATLNFVFFIRTEAASPSLAVQGATIGLPYVMCVICALIFFYLVPSFMIYLFGVSKQEGVEMAAGRKLALKQMLQDRGEPPEEEAKASSAPDAGRKWRENPLLLKGGSASRQKLVLRAAPLGRGKRPGSAATPAASAAAAPPSAAKPTGSPPPDSLNALRVKMAAFAPT